MKDEDVQNQILMEILEELKAQSKMLYQLTEDMWRIKMTVYGDR